MNKRRLGKTGFQISEVALGTWQVGGGWGGRFDHKAAERILNTALDNGINFIDTADVYDNGLSESAVGKAVRSRSETIYVASKCGRQINPHVNEVYTPQALRNYVEDSLRRLGLDRIDLIQLHCPPTEVYSRPEIFGLFDRLKEEGKIANLGVSVEKVKEAEKAIEYENVTTVQIIFNMMRLKPAETFFQVAAKNDVGIIVRVPLASGLLSGKITPSSSFDPQDHRSFNREGKAFDKGETFSGVPLDLGFKVVEEIQKVVGTEEALAAYALRWILMFPEVSTVIPGASNADQVLRNIDAAKKPAFSEQQMQDIQAIYDNFLRSEIHPQW